MEKKKARKLALTKETLERLDDRTLARFGVRGGGLGREEIPSDSLPECCGGTN